MELQPFKVPRKRRSKKQREAEARMAAGGAIDIGPSEMEIPSEDANITVDPDTGSVEVQNDDGSITIDPTGQMLFQTPDDGPGTHDENLSHKIDGMELGRIADELITAIEADKQDRTQWEQMRAKCIELLGLKLEDPKGDVSRSALGVSTSVVRDPVLLEAVERFRANAYAEMCPSSGPVKVVNLSDDKIATDPLATELEKDLNYYLTTTASEYYPDTRYMLWWTGLASGTFKKVYKCPLRNRPVSEFVDGTDLIVPASATDLKNASRITHEVKMAKDVMRAMQLAGVYRDVVLSDPLQPSINPVAAKIARIDGKAETPQRIEDQEYTVYEVYCKLDIRGYEHKQNGKATGLPLPYRVTIEAGSRQVIEVRRNWDEEDDNEIFRQPHIPFVLFPYSTGISRIYGSGLGQMMGNMASALTAMLRISIDNGMMSNYPGLLKAKSDGRQVQNEIMVPPGGCADVDTGGLPIHQAVMAMPFKDVSGNVMGLMSQLRDVAQRLGGTADMPVGEGRQDAPVGTTLAMIEQATKIEGSVHKALHAAQSEEFRLLVKLFREDPEALWRGNRRPAMGSAQDDAARKIRLDRFKQALDNCDIIPMADPNVPSGMHRNLMAMGVKQMTAGNPAYDQTRVDAFVFKQLFKMGDSDFKSLLAPPTVGAPQIDPAIMAQVQLKQQELQIRAADVANKAQQAEKDRQSKENIAALSMAQRHAAATAPQADQQPNPVDVAALNLKAHQLQMQQQKMSLDAHNAHADRQSKETVEALKIAQAIAVHPLSDQIVDQQLADMAPLIKPVGMRPGGMAGGGRVPVGVSPPDSYDYDAEQEMALREALRIAQSYARARAVSLNGSGRPYYPPQAGA